MDTPQKIIPKTIGIIPARYASTRFPGKPLVQIQGKSMIQRVYEQASQAKHLQKVVVATDDERIERHIRSFGGQVCMTRGDHQSGTDRCAEVAAAETGFEYVVNIQGDEPFVQPQQIDALIALVTNTPAAPIATLAKPITDITTFQNPNIVKVVFDKKGTALYFSRSPIPHARGEKQAFVPETAYKHIGLYAFERSTLLQLAQLEKGILEQVESLEQLRWLENGFSIQVGITHIETIGIDTPEDIARLTTNQPIPK